MPHSPAALITASTGSTGSLLQKISVPAHPAVSSSSRASSPSSCWWAPSTRDGLCKQSSKSSPCWESHAEAASSISSVPRPVFVPQSNSLTAACIANSEEPDVSTVTASLISSRMGGVSTDCTSDGASAAIGGEVGHTVFRNGHIKPFMRNIIQESVFCQKGTVCRLRADGEENGAVSLPGKLGDRLAGKQPFSAFGQGAVGIQPDL